MKNDYEVRGDITAIYLERKNGERLETIISTNRLPEVLKIGVKLVPCDMQNGTYAHYHTKTSTRSLHRYLCKPPRGMCVDHWNKDTLDNRNENLKIVSQSMNMQNRGKHPINTTGFKGVSYNPTATTSKKFAAQVTIDKKHHWIGRFATAEEAHEAYSNYVSNQKLHFNSEANNG